MGDSGRPRGVRTAACHSLLFLNQGCPELGRGQCGVVRPVLPCDGECVPDALGPPISITYSALALIALHCVASIPFQGFVGYFMGRDCTGGGGELLAGTAGLA